MYYIAKDAGYFIDFLQVLDGTGINWGEMATAMPYYNLMAAAHQAKILGADVMRVTDDNRLKWITLRGD